MHIRLAGSLVVASLALAACDHPAPVTPRSGRGILFSQTPHVVHTLALNTGNDDAALTAWQNAINADTLSDTVWAAIPKGSITMRHLPYLSIFSGRIRPMRYVDISGYSKDSSIFNLDSSAHLPNGVFAFKIQDSRVHIHDLTVIGHADSTQLPINSDGSTDAGIQFDGSLGGTYAEVNNIVVRGFRLAGIDVYKMKGAFIHDNLVFCMSSNSSTKYQQSMGIWMRGLPAPPPPGITNGTIQSNTVWNCGAEGLNIEDVQYVQVRWNTVSCDGPGCPMGFRDGGHGFPLGIALYNDVCSDVEAVSYNRIDRNTVYGNQSLTGGIAIQSADKNHVTGLGYNNTIDSNVVYNILELGISDTPGLCSPGHSIHNNFITANTVEHTQNTSGQPSNVPIYDIYTNGLDDSVTFNQVCSTDVPHTISSSDTTTDFVGNTHITCP